MKTAESFVFDRAANSFKPEHLREYLRQAVHYHTSNRSLVLELEVLKMNSSPLKSVFLPIALVSSTIFSGFIVPLLLLQSGMVDGDQLSFLQETFQPILNHKDRQSKDPMIRYIGIAAITSVSAGLLTADVIRRRSQKPRVVSSMPNSLELEAAAQPIADFEVRSEWVDLSVVREEEPETDNRNERSNVESGILDAVPYYAEPSFGNERTQMPPMNPA